MNHLSRHKPIYNGTDFTLKGKVYTYLGGTWMWTEEGIVDAIKFCLKGNEDKPELTWVRPEKMFFENVNINDLRINTKDLE